MFEYLEKPRFPSKPGPTLKDLLIHDDYVIYLWFDGKWLEKLIYDISVIGSGMKHLHVWELYTFERFSSVWMHPMFPLMFFRRKMQIDLYLIFGYVNFIFVLSFLIFFILKKCYSNQFRDWFLKKHVNRFLKYAYFIHIQLLIVIFSLLFLRTFIP